ncbi:MAG: response regulator [Eubacterium sp.]|nr:response regulator [Eubacterium sp.]
MYSLLIADDEPIIRKGVSTIIDWKSLGVDQIYQAGDGEEALDIIRSHHVDLVLTDIIMPFMDGFELTEIVNREFPNIQVVVLTGHEDFEYARKSVGLGVKSFILKPIGAETLYAEMQKILKGLKKQRKEEEYISDMRLQIYRSLPILQERLLNSLITSRHGNKKQIAERAKSLELDLSASSYAVGIVAADRSKIEDRDYELYSFAVRNITYDCVGKKHLIFEDNNGNIAVLFNLDVLGEEPENTAYESLEVILKAILLTLNMKSSAALGKVAQNVDQLYESYHTAVLACESRFVLGEGGVYDSHDLNQSFDSFSYPFDQIRDLMNRVKFFGRDSLEEPLNGIRDFIEKTPNLSILNIRMIFTEITADIMKELSALQDAAPEILDHCLDFYHRIGSIPNVEDAMEQMKKLLCETADEMQRVKNNSSNRLIEKAKQVVAKRYNDADLTLSVTAEEIGVSTGYLSALFKKEEGINFIKYVTEIRMQKAMELLKTTDKHTYEVADMVGFPDAHYFSITFKKSTGMSPSEFRSQ